jgi:hypothetical protein
VFRTWICGSSIGCGKYATAALAYLVRCIANEASPDATADGGPRLRRGDINRGLGLDVRFNRRLVQSDWEKRRISGDSQKEEKMVLRSQIVRPQTEINDANNIARARNVVARWQRGVVCPISAGALG